MTKIRHLWIAAVAALLAAAPAHAQTQTPAQQATAAKMKTLLDSLEPMTGNVAIPQAQAVLHLGKDYYFLPQEQARRVLVEGWDNPPESVNDVLGMVFPADKTFLDDTWGAVITFEPVGYVSDEDAASADYDAMMTEMQSGEEADNAERKRLGYPGAHIVGWAQKPVYDVRTHSVVWARNLRFDGTSENTLNYDVRLLGRRGVLSMNLVTGMSQLAATRAAAEKFASSAEFKTGSRYADYQPGTDTKAEYGVAGLVAAGAGAAAAKKLGLLGIILAFGKKFIILILAAFAGVAAWLRRRFSGASEETYREEPASYFEATAAEHDAGAAAGDGPSEAFEGEPPRR